MTKEEISSCFVASRGNSRSSQPMRGYFEGSCDHLRSKINDFGIRNRAFLMLSGMNKHNSKKSFKNVHSKIADQKSIGYPNIPLTGMISGQM